MYSTRELQGNAFCVWNKHVSQSKLMHFMIVANVFSCQSKRATRLDSGFASGVFGHSAVLCFHEKIHFFTALFVQLTESGHDTCTLTPCTLTYPSADQGDHMADIQAFFEPSSTDTAVE